MKENQHYKHEQGLQSHNLTIEQSKKTMRIWETHMTTFCGGRYSAFKLSSELIFNLAQPTGSGVINIVDIACGYGGWSAFLQEIFKTENFKIEFTGMDASAHRLHIYQDILGKSAYTIQGNILNTLPNLDKNKFTVALLGWASHEITPLQLEQVYTSVRQLLKPGGLLLIADFVSGLLPEINELSVQLIKKQRENLLLDTKSRQQEEWLKDINKDNIHNHSKHHHDEHSQHRQDYQVNEHFRFLKNAGFSVTEEVWRYMNSSMILSVK